MGAGQDGAVRCAAYSVLCAVCCVQCVYCTVEFMAVCKVHCVVHLLVLQGGAPL